MQPHSQPDLNEEKLKQDLRDLNERYLIGLQNLAAVSQQAKMNKVQAWQNTDKLVNDFFTFSLITLGVMATILTAKVGIIGNKPLFYVALGLQAIAVVLSSITRLFIDSHASATANKVFEEFSNRINKIDAFRLAMTNTNQEEKGRVQAEMTSSFDPAYEFRPDDNNWILKNGQKTVVTIFIVAFLMFILSVVLTVGINSK